MKLVSNILETVSGLCHQRSVVLMYIGALKAQHPVEEQ
jgi:hypothetical protein